jgi:hypothetical protein
VTTRQNKERGNFKSQTSLLGSCGSKHVEWSPIPSRRKQLSPSFRS